MPLNKDEISDLKSMLDRCVQTALALENAKKADEYAKARLSDFLFGVTAKQ